jgi:hypothetical protein
MQKIALAFWLVIAMSLPSCGQQLDKGVFSPMNRSLNNTPHGYLILPDPTGSAPTSMVERFEVRPGDCGESPGWSDCETDRERSELFANKDRLGSSWWYGWSIFVPKHYPVVYPTKTALGQFHQVGAQPAFMFQNHSGGLTIDRNFGRTTNTHQLITHEEMVGRWTTIEVYAEWGAEGTFRVYVNGDLEWVFTGTTAEADPYFKYGIYRSFLSRYISHSGEGEVPAQVVLYSNVRQARSRAGLQSGYDNESLPEDGYVRARLWWK